MRQQGVVCDFSSSESWVVLTPIEQSIKRKIEAVGTPLSKWDINIYRGVLTGCNEAFIIDTAKRDEILANCKSADERDRTEALIRPILRGRDIKRYGYNWANLWLIATFPARNYDIEEFPAVKQYLLSFAEDFLRSNGYDWVADKYLAEFCRKKLEQNGKPIEINGKRIVTKSGGQKNPEEQKARKKTNNKWFETQDSISYWDDFDKPKITWADLARTGNAFIYDEKRFFSTNTTYLMSSSNKKLLKFLVGVLNSKTMLTYLDWISAKLDETGWRWFKQYVEAFPIPTTGLQQETIGETVDHILKRLSDMPDASTDDLEKEIDENVFDLYDFSEAERAALRSH